MIKLDRRRRRKQKNEEEEEEERTEVGFQQDLIADKLEASENRPGGLQIRRKSSSASVEDDSGTRKGPAMPPPEVLAALAKQEVSVPKPEIEETTSIEDKKENKSEETQPITETEAKPKEAEEKKIEEQKIEKFEKPKTEDNFKAPSLPGMKPPEPKAAAPSCDQKFNLPSEIYKSPKVPEQNAPPKAPKETPKFAYREPDWSDVCENTEYNLEVLKGGKIIGKYDLSGKSCHVLGKLDTCDLKLEHPRNWLSPFKLFVLNRMCENHKKSISRYHLIFQWHKLDSTWKIMDYGSTHGVKVNKMKLKPHQYVRCTVGSVLDIGLSTRKYVMNGPAEDQLKESEESGFELREKYKKRQKKLEKQMMGESDSDSDDEDTKKKEIFQYS